MKNPYNTRIIDVSAGLGEFKLKYMIESVNKTQAAGILKMVLPGNWEILTKYPYPEGISRITGLQWLWLCTKHWVDGEITAVLRLIGMLESLRSSTAVLHSLEISVERILSCGRLMFRLCRTFLYAFDAMTLVVE